MPHRLYGQQLDLFHFEEHSPGMAFWHPKGWKLFTLIQNYIREMHETHGYQEVRTPTLLSTELWRTSGHLYKFNQNMFFSGDMDIVWNGVAESELDPGQLYDDYLANHPDMNRSIDVVHPTYALKPMSCPAHIEIYRHKKRSYRELPQRLFEFGVVHRNESSGSLHGLMRIRQFTQDDVHIFCREDQMLDETKNYIELLKKIYAKFGFTDIVVKLSTRPDERFGDDTLWDKAEKALSDACDELGIKYELQPGEGAFYGPKLEFTLFDSNKRPWQCGTIQCDFILPEKFELTYVNREGNEKERPVILHHAVLGSIERWIGILLENNDGKLPAWLSPIEVALLPVSEKVGVYADVVHNMLKNKGIRVILDDSSDTLPNRVRIHSEQKIPYIAVVGEKEVKENKIAVRVLGDNKSQTMDLHLFMSMLRD